MQKKIASDTFRTKKADADAMVKHSLQEQALVSARSSMMIRIIALLDIELVVNRATGSLLWARKTKLRSSHCRSRVLVTSNARPGGLSIE